MAPFGALMRQRWSQAQPQNQTGVLNMNKTLARHKEAVRRREQAELAMVITVIVAVSSVWLAFATVSAIIGA